MSLATLRGIGKQYDMGENPVHAIREISMNIDAGEAVAIVGPSGSGKSTLLGILGCLDPATRGTYRLADQDVGAMSRAELAEFRCRRIGFVFQNFNLLPKLTALENVELPLAYAGLKSSLRGERARAILDRVGLADRRSHFPNQLSGGQQQRVAIARALVNEPDLVLADEPTGALDTATGREILSILQDVNADGTTVMIVTHDLNVAATMRRTIALADGRIRSDGRSGAAARSPWPQTLASWL
ncbi:ABC transporter ATP-binding protein [Mesorhizobium abyssinicae]|uniref:ABC transporter ATP-binding protein n=1 Tax=Mesorhizobium abyssinicae TaxID=1209958 RepID=UPI002A23D08C|nr:ABC transporter ATP-binding protein [Mesorhizobium abyssinicae]MDX8437570.1 ABC transporter ATP-binding protein [Mesorhizobium abyssinicae]